MAGVTLTELQQKFAEENHGVLLNFLKHRGLAEDQFYDIVVFGFLKAVQECNLYDNSDFGIFADECMQIELDRYFIDEKKKKGNVKILSLDYVISKKDGLLLSDIIADEKNDFCEDICRKLSRPKQYRLSHITKNAIQSARLVGMGGDMCSGF